MFSLPIQLFNREHFSVNIGHYVQEVTMECVFYMNDVVGHFRSFRSGLVWAIHIYRDASLTLPRKNSRHKFHSGEPVVPHLPVVLVDHL